VLFNSWEYALFLPVVLAAYYSLTHRAQNYFLLGASYFFYGWWDYRFSLLMAFSTVVDYVVAREMARSDDPRRRKKYLLISLVTNLGILGFFKYFNFFVDSMARLCATLGIPAHLPILRIVLPVGISFYTFQAMAYTIDVYRRDHPPARSFLDFALYVCFFPHLVAGPIQRYMLLEQIQRVRHTRWDQISSGCVLILIGLVRKVAIADYLASYVDRAFSQPQQLGSLDLLLGLYLFSLQIYCDFAGYTDIARGTSRLLGIELMVNFRHPYFSTNITEFWRRWHLSLSSWLRDYLYISLGGNRHGRLRTYANLIWTMLLGGLWHGASWTFVVWGGLHGLYLAAHKLLLGDRRPEVENRGRTWNQWPIDLAKMILTFHLVALTWIFFRASGFGMAWDYLAGILALRGGWPMEGVLPLVASLLLLLFIDVPQYRSNDHTALIRWSWPIRGLAYASMIWAIFALRTDGTVPFIYFQF
jgi:alginate O-acetyltransferase complex protein AlgI